MRRVRKVARWWGLGCACVLACPWSVYAQSSGPAATSVSVGPEGLTVTSSDAQHAIRIRGYVQSDARVLTSDAPVNDSATFLVRRARPVIEATMFGRFHLRLMPDFGEGRTTLQDAYMEARLGALARIRFGKFKAPFGLERLSSATELAFVERAAPTQLAPNRDVGLLVHGETGRQRLTYGVALSNGVPDGASGDADTHPGKDLVGRLFIRPFPPQTILSRLAVGGAFSRGFESGVPTEPLLPAFRTTGQHVFFRFRTDGSARGTVLADGGRVRTSLQANWVGGPIGAVAEWTRSRQELTLGGESGRVTSEAWMLGASLVLTGERASARAVVPRRPFSPERQGWGAVEIVARMSRLAVDAAAFPRFADPARAARAAFESAAGVNWYLNRTVKISGSFHDTRFDGGDPAGDRPNERLILMRMQFAL